jgi:hypothetical protein
MISVLLDLLEELLDAFGSGRVCRRRDGLGAGLEVRLAVQGSDCFVASGSLARRNEDFAAACLKKPVRESVMLDQSLRGSPISTNADAAERPRPREPPVTTATLPLREKSDG